MGSPTGARKFFSSKTSTAFSEILHFGFLAKNLLISNDTSNDITYSLDGTNIDGILKANETLELRDYVASDKIWFSSTSGNDSFRIWAW